MFEFLKNRRSHRRAEEIGRLIGGRLESFLVGRAHPESHRLLAAFGERIERIRADGAAPTDDRIRAEVSRFLAELDTFCSAMASEARLACRSFEADIRDLGIEGQLDQMLERKLKRLRLDLVRSAIARVKPGEASKAAA
ncbi:hypothetical protein [Prosthecomicrobium sp. N25]|uniref:hypothetical protein n=1 Tax=Prosthecomicrobium sp. N25 TaxID=3129254 RepID=UPI0030777F9A